MTDYDPEYPEISVEYFWRELQRIKTALEKTHNFSVTYVEPEKPRTGDVVYADGTEWNPGSGEGIYRYSISGTWALLG